MNSDVKRKWVEALRSGKYKQGRSFLRNTRDEFCCLGVLCDLLDSSKWNLHKGDDCFEYDGEIGYLPEDIALDLGLRDREENEIIIMNDGRDHYDNSVDIKSFSQIADYIEENL